MMFGASLLDDLELFHGQATEALCRVYARLRTPPANVAGVEGSWRLTGKLSGPTCPYAQTLPATFEFTSRGALPSLLAEAVVPEPVGWTPELPQLYEAQLQLHDGSRLVAETRRTFGIRRLGARGRGLSLGGRPWVLRGVQAVNLGEWSLHEPRTCDATLLVPAATDLLCDSASRTGVLLMVELNTAEPTEIRRLAHWPAVGLVVLPAGTEVELAGLGHNLLMVERFSAEQSVRPQPWANVALVEVESLDDLPERLAGCAVPILALRNAPSANTMANARVECDRLQRDLAPIGQFAGYIV